MKMRMKVLAPLCLLSAMAFAQQGSLLPMPKLQFFDNSGAVCSGCKVYSYSAGTSNKRDTYTDASLGTPNSNPVTLDSAGRWNIWLSANAYKIVLTTADGVQIWSVDNVAGTNGGVALSLDSPPPIGDVTPNTGNFTTLTAASVNTVVNPITNPAGDIGPQINAVLAAGVHVLIPSRAAGYLVSTAISNTYDGVTIECADQKTVLTWSLSTGSMFKTDGTQRVLFKNCTVNTVVAANTSVCLQIGGSAYTANTLVDNWSCGVEDGTKHFDKAFWVTGNDTTGPSGNTRIVNSHARNYTTCGFCFDHTIDPYLELSDAYAPNPNSTNAIGILSDTGASGLHINMSSVGNAGMVVQNSMPTANAYGKPPNYMQVTNSAVCDTSPGHGLLFDASLDTLSGPGSAFRGDTYALTNVWCSGAGYGYAATSPAQSAVVIQGGTQFHFTDMLIRYNKCNGFEIDGGDHIYIDGGYTRANNAGNFADGAGDCPHASGVYVAPDVNDILVRGVDMRGTNSYESAHQLYGMYVDAGTSDRIEVYQSNARNEQLAGISNNGTGTHNRTDLNEYDSSAIPTFRERTSFLDSTFYFDLIGGYPGFNYGASDYQYYVAASHQLNLSFNGTTGFLNPNFFSYNGVFQGPAFKSSGANAASAGLIRANKTDVLNWRNNANSADLSLGIDGSNNLTFTSAIIPLTSAASANKAICWKTATTLGYCSTVVAADGSCTCN